MIKIRKEKFEMIKRAREAKWRTKRQRKPLETAKKEIREETVEEPLEKVAEVTEKIEEAPTEIKEEKEIKPGMKICLGCGKQINEHWTYHKCGWKE